MIIKVDQVYIIFHFLVRQYCTFLIHNIAYQQKHTHNFVRIEHHVSNSIIPGSQPHVTPNW